MHQFYFTINYFYFEGPLMHKILEKGLDFDLSSLSFMQNRMATVFGVENCRITRCGYTGEDGVEVNDYLYFN